jgi:hypothetical protein
LKNVLVFFLAGPQRPELAQVEARQVHLRRGVADAKRFAVGRAADAGGPAQAATAGYLGVEVHGRTLPQPPAQKERSGKRKLSIFAGLQAVTAGVARIQVIVPLLNNGLLKVQAPVFIVGVVHRLLRRGSGRLQAGQRGGRRRHLALRQRLASHQGQGNYPQRPQKVRFHQAEKNKAASNTAGKSKPGAGAGLPFI